MKKKYLFFVSLILLFNISFGQTLNLVNQDDDGDGIPNNIDQYPETIYNSKTVLINNVAFDPTDQDIDGDGIPNDKDICPQTPEGSTVNEFGCAEDQIGYITEISLSNASKWIGGDDRTNSGFDPRNVGTGQSVLLYENYILNSFSVLFQAQFDYSQEYEGVGHEVEIILQLRNSTGEIISQTQKIIPNSFMGGWVKFDFDNPQYLNANKQYYFTWYLKDGLISNLNTGSNGFASSNYSSNIYELGTGYSSQFKEPDNDSYFDDFNNWWEHPWDFCFKLAGKFESDNSDTICENVGITASTYPETDDLNQKVKDEFGDEFTIADWNDIKNMENLDDWVPCMGLQHDDTFMVTRDGNYIYSGNRQYYVHYSTDGVPNSGFLVHDKVGDFYLGSWYGLNMKILTKKGGALAIEDFQDKSFNIFPNPVSDILTIDSKLELNKVGIYSILGKKVKEINTNFNSISTSDLLSGIYLVRIESENGLVVKKLIKQ